MGLANFSRSAVLLLLISGLLTVQTEAQTSTTANNNATQPFELQVVGPDGKPVPDVTVTFRTPLAPVTKPALAAASCSWSTTGLQKLHPRKGCRCSWKPVNPRI
jgi:hypothetical protein